MNYGIELILDLHDCNVEKFNRKDIKLFFRKLCKILDMKPEDLHFWDYEGKPEEYKKAPSHLKGISAIQFISTSNVTIHTLDELRKVYINIFSCKNFFADEAACFCRDFFQGEVAKVTVVDRI